MIVNSQLANTFNSFELRNDIWRGGCEPHVFGCLADNLDKRLVDHQFALADNCHLVAQFLYFA